MSSTIRRALRSAWRNDAAFALPTVMLGTIAAMGLGTAMVTSSLSATAGATRDTNTKRAFAVAEAGVSHALFRYNRYNTAAVPCINEASGGQVVLEPAQSTGWCRPVTGSSSGGSYSYAVKPTAPCVGNVTKSCMTIVSTGVFEGLSRRIQVEATYETKVGFGQLAPFEDQQVIGKDGITIGQGGRVTANVGTYGQLAVEHGGQLDCDRAQASSTNFHNSQSSSCEPTAPDFDLPAVDSSYPKSNNQNASLAGSGCHSFTGLQLTLSNTCALTLGTAGATSDFYLCKLSLNHSSQLRVAAGATVNIWFAPPEECGGDTLPFVGATGSKILTPGTAPATSLAFIVSDSPTRTSMVLQAGGRNWPECTDNFIIYAPTTDVVLETGPHICGAVAANTLSLAPGSSLTKTSASAVWELPGSTGGPSPHYVASSFLECTVTNTDTAPDAGC